MPEVFLQPPDSLQPQSTEVGSHFRKRIKDRLRNASERTLSFAELGASILLQHNKVRRTKAEVQRQAVPYEGLIESQANEDNLVSLELAATLELDLQDAAWRYGIQHSDYLPTEERKTIAQNVVEARLTDIITEITLQHPYFNDEKIEALARERAADMMQLLSMNRNEREIYERALFNYLNAKAVLSGQKVELKDLQNERDEKLLQFGTVAVEGTIKSFNKMRDLPYVLSSKTFLFAERAKERYGAWYENLDEDRKGRLKTTVLGVAIGGLLGAIAWRMGAGHGVGESSSASFRYELTNYDPSNPDIPPTDITRIGGTPIESTLTETQPPATGEGDYTVIGGSPEADDITVIGGEPKENDITIIGGEPDEGTSEADNKTPEPKKPQGVDLSHINNSSELFANGSNNVEKWPTQITVSRWNSATLDGSLSGISKQMLYRAGIGNPNAQQINNLVDALRPQAQPNGFLLEGQKLDLTPATQLLKKMVP